MLRWIEAELLEKVEVFRAKEIGRFEEGSLFLRQTERGELQHRVTDRIGGSASEAVPSSIREFVAGGEIRVG